MVALCPAASLHALAPLQCPVDHSLFLPKTVTLGPAGSQGKEVGSSPPDTGHVALVEDR